MAMGAVAGIVRFDERSPDRDVVRTMLTLSSPQDKAGGALVSSDLACFGGSELADDTGDAGFLLAGDVRIDNAAELRRRLGMHHDGEVSRVLVAAYAAWGNAYPQSVVGDFAVAVWDQRERRLLVARDHIGVKPLYYFYLPRRLCAFASTIRALQAVTELQVRFDDTTIVNFLAEIEPDPYRTFYEHVLRLPPAHTLEVLSSSATARRYWTPDPTKTVRFASDHEYAEAFRGIFENAVECRLNDVQQAAVTLSGGLDSSSVACMAQHLSRNTPIKLSAFSLVHGATPNGDERRYALEVLRSSRLDGTFLDVSRRRPLRHVIAFGRHNEAPAIHPYASDWYDLYADMAAQGISSVLDGVGGDTTLYYGFYYLRDLARRLRWATVLQEAYGLSRHYCDGGASVLSLLTSFCVVTPQPLRGLRLSQWLGRTGGMPGPASLLTDRVLAKHDVVSRLYVDRDAPRRMAHCEAHAYGLTHPTVSAGLETIHKLTAAFGIEPRHPFYDRRLVEFCLGLPREQLVAHGWIRPVLRRGLDDILPRAVQARATKSSPTQNFAERLLRLERRTLEETAGDEDVLGDYLDMKRVNGAMHRYFRSGTYTDAMAVWPAISLRQWLRSAAWGSPDPHRGGARVSAG